MVVVRRLLVAHAPLEAEGSSGNLFGDGHTRGSPRRVQRATGSPAEAGEGARKPGSQRASGRGGWASRYVARVDVATVNGRGRGGEW